METMLYSALTSEFLSGRPDVFGLPDYYVRRLCLFTHVFFRNIL